MRLTPVRFFLAAFLIGALIIVVVMPNAPIADTFALRFEDPGATNPQYLQLQRRFVRENRRLQALRAELVRSRAATSLRSVATKPGTPILPDPAVYRAAMSWKGRSLDSLAAQGVSARPTAQQIADSIAHLHDRFAAGSLGDVRAALLLVPADSGATTPFDRFSGWLVTPSGTLQQDCAVMYAPPQLRDHARSGNLFGPCFWFGAFGAPGRAGSEWIASGGLQGWGWIAPLRHRANDDEPLTAFGPRKMRQARFLDELLMTTMYGTNVVRCIARGGDACAYDLRRPWSADEMRAPLSRAGLYDLRSTFRAGPFVVASDLYDEFGAERFAKLWRSPLPFDEAFAQVMDEDVRDYVRRRATEMTASGYVPGPWLSPWTTVTALMVVTAGFGFVVMNSRRPAAV